MDQKFCINRSLGMANATVSLNCEPGKITLLSDPEGSNLLCYHRAFTQDAKAESVSFHYADREYPLAECARVGLNEQFKEEITTRQFLLSLGLSEAELTDILDEFDLKKYASYPCVSLSATAGRQLQLIKVLTTDAPVLILNDPLQPFSGRWRENFAEKLLEDIISKKRIAVVLNLSFVPNAWADSPALQRIDVTKATNQALEKALMAAREREQRLEAERKAKERQQEIERKEREKLEKQQAQQKADESSTAEADAIALEDISFGYRITRDFIFQPLADLSDSLRHWSGAWAAAGVSVLCLAAGVLYYPNSEFYRKKIEALSEKTDSMQALKTYVKEQLNPPAKAENPVDQTESNSEPEIDGLLRIDRSDQQGNQEIAPSMESEISNQFETVIQSEDQAVCDWQKKLDQIAAYVAGDLSLRTDAYSETSCLAETQPLMSLSDISADPVIEPANSSNS